MSNLPVHPESLRELVLEGKILPRNLGSAWNNQEIQQLGSLRAMGFEFGDIYQYHYREILKMPKDWRIVEDRNVPYYKGHPSLVMKDRENRSRFCIVSSDIYDSEVHIDDIVRRFDLSFFRRQMDGPYQEELFMRFSDAAGGTTYESVGILRLKTFMSEYRSYLFPRLYNLETRCDDYNYSYYGLSVKRAFDHLKLIEQQVLTLCKSEFSSAFADALQNPDRLYYDWDVNLTEPTEAYLSALDSEMAKLREQAENAFHEMRKQEFMNLNIT